MRKRIVPVTDKDADGAESVRRVPMPLDNGGGDLPADGAWIDNDRWVARRERDGDIKDVTKDYLASMKSLEDAAAKAAAAATTQAVSTASKTAPATTSASSATPSTSSSGA